jgi:hypothetical protein
MLTSNQQLLGDELGIFLKPRLHKDLGSIQALQDTEPFQEQQATPVHPHAASWTEDLQLPHHGHAFIPHQKLLSIHKSSTLCMRPNTSTNPFIISKLHKHGYTYLSNDAVSVHQTLSHKRIFIITLHSLSENS